jgi:hypothetical protein
VSEGGAGALERLLGAVAKSIDEDRLRQELGAWLGPKGGRSAEATASDETQAEDGGQSVATPISGSGGAVLDKIVLADLLDDSILGARPGDTPFPLRLFLGQLGESLQKDTAFALACGLNFYFRTPMEDEDKARLGFEISRLYYRFADEVLVEEGLVPQVSPLLADLMSSELAKLRLESIDHETVFDSRRHEREPTGDGSSPKITRPASFLGVVSANKMVRVKARVWT